MTHVSRSVYQKLAEENKRLLHDLYVIVMKFDTTEAIHVDEKWHKKFRAKHDFNEALKELLTKKKE